MSLPWSPPEGEYRPYALLGCSCGAEIKTATSVGFLDLTENLAPFPPSSFFSPFTFMRFIDNEQDHLSTVGHWQQESHFTPIFLRSPSRQLDNIGTITGKGEIFHGVCSGFNPDGFL